MKIAIFAGPTGGHFFPALAFAECFLKRDPEARILFVTGVRGRSLAEKAKDRIEAQFEFLPDFPFPEPHRLDFLTRMVPFLLKLIQAFLKTEKMLTGFKPDLAVGFGSYVAFPGLLTSARRKIPSLIHEQNRTLGRANRWLGRWVNRIALSFELAPPIPSFRFTLTGLPLRSTLLVRATQKRRVEPSPLSANRVRILIVGGSQGSHSLNRLWTGAIQLLSDEEKSKIAVIHITGEKDLSWVETMYLSKGIEALVFPFHERMEEVYPEADLAVTRAGAGTLFELALFALPAIVLPYPHAEGHQEENARYFEKEKAIVRLSEEGSTPEGFKEQVFQLVNSPLLRNRMSQNLERLAKPEASQRLVEIAEELLIEKEPCLT